MSQIPYISSKDVGHSLDWLMMVDAILEGHKLERAKIDDIIFKRGDDTLLNRAAWINGLGSGVKTATIFAGNADRSPSLPSVHSVMTLFDDETGVPKAVIDGTLVTKWKTAADSVAGATLLARSDSKRLLIVGAGTVATSLVKAYMELFPGLEQVQIWNRTPAKADTLAKTFQKMQLPVCSVSDIAGAVAEADIVSCATMSKDPVVRGEWVTPGTHVDLIGAFRSDMREADDALLRKSAIYVDSRETTIPHIGELKIPIDQGLITPEDVLGDLYDLCCGESRRSGDEQITLFKNGGGAHLDLMVADVIYQRYLPLS